MITIKINVTKIDKAHLYQGKNGKYLDLIAWENRNGPDQYGNTHTVCQSVSKEQRDRGVKGPIVGNAKVTERRAPSGQGGAAPQDDVPF